MTPKAKKDFLLAGIGGQGIILTSDLLAEVGLAAGYDVKKSEVHGMAQRGGSVETHVRWTEKVHSPLVEPGRVDYLVGFEMLEAARWAHFLGPGSKALVNRYRVYPPAVNLGEARYPEPEEVEDLLKTRGAEVRWAEASEVAIGLGNPALAGTVLLGLLSLQLGVPEEVWLEVIARRVPERFVELNQQAFLVGRGMSAPRIGA
ncbi:MAG: indolepyruvate oxidoreductase subunit beta [Clostridia bacterium]|jgi:indolepyruvate ferredoxin oxidoreductase beta subunit|nr:indolepyruvate oxidoreductase subunit beta [Clostridia bacterium]MDH7573972.1 indolepyruvate oxidoreductase subunit beta [Clostridia bacterium]